MIRAFYRKILPFKIREKIGIYRSVLSEYIQKKKVIHYLLDNINNDLEKKEIADWLKNNKLISFPYEFVKKYNDENIEVFYSEENNCYYVKYEGKNLYFKKSWSKEQVKKYFNSLLIEQDDDSPHKYLINREKAPSTNDIVADMGGAEGIFSLSVIDRCKKIYIFECDEEWIEVLRLTFGEYGDKVTIVNKFIGSIDDDKNVTLDTFFQGLDLDYIKADIEGSEIDLLKKGKITLSNKVSKVVLCSYHNHDDSEKIVEYLNQYGYMCDYSKGYMFYEQWNKNNFKEPYVRRGLVFGTRG